MEIEKEMQEGREEEYARFEEKVRAEERAYMNMHAQ